MPVRARATSSRPTPPRSASPTCSRCSTTDACAGRRPTVMASCARCATKAWIRRGSARVVLGAGGAARHRARARERRCRRHGRGAPARRGRSAAGMRGAQSVHIDDVGAFDPFDQRHPRRHAGGVAGHRREPSQPVATGGRHHLSPHGNAIARRRPARGAPCANGLGMLVHQAARVRAVDGRRRTARRDARLPPRSMRAQ